MTDHKRAIASGIAAVFGLLILAGCSDGDTDTGGCGMSFCGCSYDTTVAFSADVLNGETLEPVAGIEVYCDAEMEQVGVSDAMGHIFFTVATTVSAGCGPERCYDLRLRDPTGLLADITGTFSELDGARLTMSYKPD